MFSPVSTSTVQFAKDYRADQIRTADQARIAASFRRPRSRRVRSAITAAALRVEQRSARRQTRRAATTSAATLSETVGS